MILYAAIILFFFYKRQKSNSRISIKWKLRDQKWNRNSHSLETNEIAELDLIKRNLTPFLSFNLFSFDINKTQ